MMLEQGLTSSRWPFFAEGLGILSMIPARVRSKSSHTLPVICSERQSFTFRGVRFMWGGISRAGHTESQGLRDFFDT